MKKITSKEIKDKFLKFFKENSHTQINDSSIIPKNDPTLLFINSGMAPIKDYFTGFQSPPSPRLCNVQPCIRTIDIDSIGDKHHLTSFQMLGSWSINDYFKEKAICFAFKFLTESIGIDKEKLYVTIFSGDKNLNLPRDQESYDFWIKTGVREDHIVECGKDDNFWGPTSETGPCGPCTEIFYDTGDGEKYVPGGEFDTKKRYIEIWNAGVFMQLNKNVDGTFSKLAFNSVDTGAGLERLAMVLGGYSSVYETDLLRPIKEKIKENLKNDLSEKDLLILTDHLRTISLILSEKVSPSNEGRGYTPRKLIRRCMMIISKNKVKNFDFVSIIDFILGEYENDFPKFKENRDFIINEFTKEHHQFEKVLEEGLEKLDELKKDGIFVSAEAAFDLVTTYGLPFDIIKQYAKENNLTVDEKGFEEKINIHKEKSKNVNVKKETGKLKAWLNMTSNCQRTTFLGYETLSSDGIIEKIIYEDRFTQEALPGETVGVILNKTCLYAESGGQCSDRGVILGSGFKIDVSEIRKTKEGVFVHLGTVEGAAVKVGTEVLVTADKTKRKDTSRNHTATHLLHSALQEVYGKGVHQAGSKVEDKRLRFDFNYEGNVNEDEICKLERIVNSRIRDNLKRKVEVKELSEAISQGAMALFESKYGEKVRVVSYGDVSKELCGGTHVEQTGEIGLFIIINAEGIGKGVKRITAITGEEALKYVQEKIRDINLISKLYKVKPDKLIGKIEKELSSKTKKIETVSDISNADVKRIKLKSGISVGYCKLNEIGKKINNEIINAAEKVKGIFVCICGEGKKRIILSVSDILQEKFKANEIIAKILEDFGGKGGGNQKLATGGGLIFSDEKLITKLEEICKN